jgi:hypothetical protein
MLRPGERRALRQGDIIADVPFPLARLRASPKFLATYAAGRDQAVELKASMEQIGHTWWLTAQISTSITFCAVLSQDCDVDPGQHPPPPSFLLCRLKLVPEGIRSSPTSYEALRENPDPYDAEKHGFHALFYIGEYPELGPGEYMADFGQVMTVVRKDYNEILKRKVLEMDDLARAKFRVKAGAFLGRPTKEELAAGTADPWRRPRGPTEE